MTENWTYLAQPPGIAQSTEYIASNAQEPCQEDCSNGIIPAEVGTETEDGKRRILVPELTSMTKFLFQQYRLFMFSFLNKCLRNGQLARIVGFRFANRILNRESCSFGSVSYWKLDRERFFADVVVKLKLDTDDDEREWDGILRLFFDLSGDIICHVEDFGEYLDSTDYNLVPMDKYLIACYKNKMIDQEAEKLWTDYCCDALSNPRMRKADELAKAMGLTIVRLPVYQHNGVSSMIFFREGDLLVKEETRVDKSAPRQVTVPADTIVINTNLCRTEYPAFDIFHECFHYEHHYLFYRLQEMCNNDIRNVATKEIIVDKDSQIKDPIYFLEKQANRGAYGLMMPATHTRAVIEKKCSEAIGYRHAGEKFQMVGQAMSRELGFPQFRVRARMIQLGYLEAKGALNYVDRHMIAPFACDPEALKVEKFTYVIDRQTSINLCWNNDEFKKVMQSGEFIYADGHIVRNCPKCVKETKSGFVLTEWANSHEDSCCLRFVKLYIQNSIGKYVFGRLNYDADYVKQTQFYLEDILLTEHLDDLDAKFEYCQRFPKTFHEAFDLVRKKNGYSMKKVAELLNISVKTLSRWLDDPCKYNNEDFVTTISLLFMLPDWLSKLMFKRAHIQLDDEDRRHQAIEYILRVQPTEGVEKANEFLIKCHLAPLSI